MWSNTNLSIERNPCVKPWKCEPWTRWKILLLMATYRMQIKKRRRKMLPLKTEKEEWMRWGMKIQEWDLRRDEHARCLSFFLSLLNWINWIRYSLLRISNKGYFRYSASFSVPFSFSLKPKQKLGADSIGITIITLKQNISKLRRY